MPGQQQRAEAGEALLGQQQLLPWVQARQRRGQQEDWERTCWLHVVLERSRCKKMKQRKKWRRLPRSYFWVVATSTSDQTPSSSEAREHSTEHTSAAIQPPQHELHDVTTNFLVPERG